MKRMITTVSYHFYLRNYCPKIDYSPDMWRDTKWRPFTIVQLGIAKDSSANLESMFPEHLWRVRITALCRNVHVLILRLDPKTILLLSLQYPCVNVRGDVHLTIQSRRELTTAISAQFRLLLILNGGVPYIYFI